MAHVAFQHQKWQMAEKARVAREAREEETRKQQISDAEAVEKLLEVVEKLEAELYDAERMR